MRLLAMFRWLRSLTRAPEPPTYRTLEAIARELAPAALLEAEQRPEFGARQDALQNEMLSLAKRPPVSAPIFAALRTSQGGVVTIPAPPDDDASGACLPLFTSPLRAADYCRVNFRSAHAMQYEFLSPAQLAERWSAMLDAGIRTLAIDRCPRCTVFSAVMIDTNKSAEDLVPLWAIARASHAARADLYVEFAASALQREELQLARDTALQCVAHVTGEDPRVHRLLETIGQRTGEQTLVREAQAFLQFLARMHKPRSGTD